MYSVRVAVKASRKSSSTTLPTGCSKVGSIGVNPTEARQRNRAAPITSIGAVRAVVDSRLRVVKGDVQRPESLLAAIPGVGACAGRLFPRVSPADGAHFMIKKL